MVQAQNISGVSPDVYENGWDASRAPSGYSSEGSNSDYPGKGKTKVKGKVKANPKSRTHRTRSERSYCDAGRTSDDDGGQNKRMKRTSANDDGGQNKGMNRTSANNDSSQNKGMKRTSANDDGGQNKGMKKTSVITCGNGSQELILSESDSQSEPELILPWKKKVSLEPLFLLSIEEQYEVENAAAGPSTQGAVTRSQIKSSVITPDHNESESWIQPASFPIASSTLNFRTNFGLTAQHARRLIPGLESIHF
ncbi:hypothetical protein K439DRAFT_951782 [Ramaria rubella]|nr:hypothetical protein K439DRAFT_951782 [Ramaria rubella]